MNADLIELRQDLCRKIIGKALNNWNTSFWDLTPTQLGGAAELLRDESLSKAVKMEIVRLVYTVLSGWGWYREAFTAGVIEAKPPWEITDEDNAALRALEPWDQPKKPKRKPKRKAEQNPLFDEANF